MASPQELLRLDGRIVVVSGAGGGGIGTTVTAMIAEAGATVIAVSRSKENLDEHVVPLARRGLSVIPVSADASTDDGIAAVMDQVRRTDGDLHGLVNVAGGAAPSTWMPSTRVTRSDWRELFTANLETAFFTSQAVAAELRAQGKPGSIVSLSSISGLNTAPFHIAYGTAKAAVVAMTRTMALELAVDGIRVNAVAPGVTETAASATYVDPDPERDRAAIAMGRRGRPEEQAGVILFLLSELSSYVTGQTLLVDGGMNLKWSHLAPDHTSLFLKDETFRAEIQEVLMTDTKDDIVAEVVEELSSPMTIGVEAYVSEAYARAERDRLWRKVWQQVGRVEEIPDVGSYLTYDILDDSIIIVRTGAHTFAAHHNVCMHRGRRLVDKPPGAKNACDRARKSFVCGFHGWTYGLDGTCTHIREQDDWQGALTPTNTHLARVHVDTWGGWLFVNMDTDPEPLADHLFPAAKILDPFGLENMRFKWRKWLNFDCNWKVALEAFNETYHVFTTHPEFNRFGEFKGWAKAQGRHSNIGYDAPKGLDETKSKIRLGSGDPRISTAEMQVYTMEETNATTTQTLVNAAKRLVDELPEGTPANKVLEHWLTSARNDDAARGVVWPTIPADVLGQSGTAWQLFPNFQIGQGLTSALCYSARPDPSYDPNKCIFEVAVCELYPNGQEPQTEWVYTPVGDPNWLSVLPQDFSNMAAVQQGMKSLGFPGTKPNPYRERSTVNLHYQLSKYMGTGAPRDLT